LNVAKRCVLNRLSVKKVAFLVVFSFLLLFVNAQNYWQQQVNYNIKVSLNEKEKTLDAYETITYFNNSPDTLHFIWFHLWPNAYKHDRTALSDQLLENGNTRFYFSGKEEKGYINKLDFKVNGVTARLEDHPQHIDIAKLILPHPLAPNQQITITTPFHVKLPFNISRGGFAGESFQVTQWYPKPAVYDKKGWHPMPYLDQGEFYSEFGNFNVEITAPENFVVAATGQLQNKKEIEWLKSRSNYSIPKMQAPVKTTAASRSKSTTKKKEIKEQPTPVTVGSKTLIFRQDSVHDFAWFANKNFIVSTDTCQLKSGRIVDVYTYYTETQKELWKNAIQYAKDAVRFYSNELGEYPFDIVSVVQGPESFGGGMEYPTITVISPTPSAKALDLVIAHEIGHNWFYGILASNERLYPWMDEGMNSYYDMRYHQMKYGAISKETKVFFQTKAVRKTDQPIATTSEEFSNTNYGLIAYHKTAQWMKLIEQKLGEQAFQEMMRNYYQKWKFKHPQPEDFKEAAAPVLGNSTEEIFALLHQKGILPGNQLTGFSVVSPLKKHSIKNYFNNPTEKVLWLSPSMGSNVYDKLMIGGLISNYSLPPTKFQFLLIPMYATGSKTFTGLGKLNYSRHSEGVIRKTDFFLNASMFTMDEFTDTAGRKLYMQFNKLVPGIRLTFKENNPRSTIRKTIQWKTFFINEESLRIIPDTVISGTDTSILQQYTLPKANRYLNRFTFAIDNSRALYPYNLNLQIEQAQDFVRPAITANYFFNYQGGGMALRFFAGKFIYTTGKSIQKQFATDRYHINMSGPNGYEDYTYSDYFMGRNKFEGLPSHQLMIRDGAFKVRSELLSSKIGKTDDWLMALNFNTSIPQKINPLSVLPINIPLRAFADVGTYAEAWDRQSDLDRFLFDAGFHIPLFNETINIYVPVIYSKVFSDYYKSTSSKNRFLKTISFSINLYNKDLRKLNQELEF